MEVEHGNAAGHGWRNAAMDPAGKENIQGDAAQMHAHASDVSPGKRAFDSLRVDVEL